MNSRRKNPFNGLEARTKGVDHFINCRSTKFLICLGLHISVTDRLALCELFVAHRRKQDVETMQVRKYNKKILSQDYIIIVSKSLGIVTQIWG